MMAGSHAGMFVCWQLICLNNSMRGKNIHLVIHSFIGSDMFGHWQHLGFCFNREKVSSDLRHLC